jgi:hypothetical protein
VSKKRHRRRPSGEPSGRWRRRAHRRGERRRRRIVVLDIRTLEAQASIPPGEEDELDLDLLELAGAIEAWEQEGRRR